MAVGSLADDPNRVPPHGKTLRDAADRDHTSDVEAREVDAGNALVAGVRHPEAAAAKGERTRPGADRDLARYPVRAGIDDRDRVPRDGRHRHGAIAQYEDSSRGHSDNGSPRQYSQK